jgi:Pentapeptide repeats (8 copies)
VDQEQQDRQQEQPRWQPTRKQLLWAGAVVALLTVAVIIGYRYGITLWNWLKLLIVPAVIAGAGLWFNAQQREREQAIARQRAQDEALQAYLDKMTDLLVVHKLSKPQDDEDKRQGETIRRVAWARTKTMLRRLDGDRKGAVLRFLNEAKLIEKGRPVIGSLVGAHLVDANLKGSVLRDTALQGVHLTGADLSGADLSGANLSNAYLSEANLSEPDLSGADLRNANLSEADLRGADLGGANLRYAQRWIEEQLLAAHSLEGATMPNGQKYEDWLKSKGGGQEGENPRPA